MDKDFDLDALFAEAAEARVIPSAELASRILNDAAMVQPTTLPWPQPSEHKMIFERPRGQFFGWVTGFADVLGGGRALAGLSLAAMTGLYLGVAEPNLVQSLTTLMSADNATVEQIDLLPSTGTLWTEN